jgi:hypothetical protein
VRNRNAGNSGDALATAGRSKQRRYEEKRDVRRIVTARAHI